MQKIRLLIAVSVADQRVVFVLRRDWLIADVHAYKGAGADCYDDVASVKRALGDQR